MSDELIKIARLEEKVDTLERLYTAVQNAFNARFEKLEAKLDEALKRPSWSVVTVVTLLTTVTGGLVVYVLTKH